MAKQVSLMSKFDKELFKRSVLYNVKTLYRKTMEEATDQQIFQAVSYAVKDAIVDNWITTQEAYDEKDPKIVYYMSMEFLMGRALGNNMINLLLIQVHKSLQCNLCFTHQFIDFIIHFIIFFFCCHKPSLLKFSHVYINNDT